MKKTRKMLCLFTMFLSFFTSCQKQVTDTDNKADSEIILASADDLEADIVFNDVYNNVGNVNEDIAFGETQIGADTQSNDPMSPHCYTITITPTTLGVFPKTVTIDFGAGCLCKDGKTRKGKIITIFTGRLKIPTSKAITTFDGYFVNNIHVEGTHVIQNNSSSDVRIITRTVTDGKLTKPNNNFILWNATHTNTQVAGSGTPNYHLDDEFTITGNATGQNNRNAKTSTWSRLIVEPLHRKTNCKWFDKGTVDITHNSHDAMLDFGDGTCNNQAMVTYNGITKEITLP
ncbi:hypothetical protein BH10BAC3_BH10BAC3_26240 [soil metagenome]